MKNICIFGDSLVYGQGDSKEGGWVNRLQYKIKGKTKFWNFGIPGDTSVDLLKRLEGELKEKNPDVVFVGIGANDSQYKKGMSENKTLIDLKNYVKNLKIISESIKKYTNDIIFIGIPNMNDSITKNWSYRYHFCNKNIETYNNELENFCKENNFTYIDIFGLLDESNLSDGAHPNSIGYEKIANEIYKNLGF